MQNTPTIRRRLPLALAVIAACLFALPTLTATAGSRSHSSSRSHTSSRSHSSSSFSFGISIGSYRHSPHFSSTYRYSSHYPSHYSSHRVIHRPVIVRPPVYCPPTVIYSRPQPTTVIYTQPRVVYAPAPAPTTVYTYSTPAPTPVVYQPAPAPRPVVYQPAPTPAVYSPPPPAPAPAPPAGPIAQQAYLDGWALLRADQSRKALNAFAAEAEQYPQRGLPKIGYALASAANNDLTKAAWAMRHAINTDPTALATLSQDDSTHRRIDHLIAIYNTRITDGYTRSDDRFMVAALQTLKLNYRAAQTAITQALSHGDNAQATSTLQRFIDQRVSQ